MRMLLIAGVVDVAIVNAQVRCRIKWWILVRSTSIILRYEHNILASIVDDVNYPSHSFSNVLMFADPSLLVQ